MKEIKSLTAYKEDDLFQNKFKCNISNFHIVILLII